jgi:hypothetical protein
MSTILELFKNTPYQSFGNKTAEQVFEVRNSKDIEITSTNAILNNTSFKLVKIARKNLSSRLEETRLEEEVTGVRIIRGLSEPVLYGTEYGRLLKRTTNILDSMKNDAVGGDDQSNGILGNFLNKIEDKGKGLLNKLGVELPDKLIPTKIKLNDDFKKGTVSELPDTLAKIKKDGAGNILGKFLAKGVSGTPNQIGNQLLGNAIGGVKDAVRKKLFGARKSGANNLASGDGVSYNETTKYSSTVDATNEDVTQRNDLTSVYEESLQKVADTLATFGLAAKGEISLEKIEKQRYSKTQIDIGTPTLDKIGFGAKSDFLNTKVPFATDDGTTPKNAENEILDDYDFITLKFFSLAKKTAVNFRATLNGLSETVSPSWQSQKTIGNPFSFYTYDGIERSVQFEFKIYSLSLLEHKAAWERLNFLTSLAYPQGSNGVYITPPFLKVTIGDWYKGKECFIDSLSYSVDDNTPWDIVNDGYKLPTIINASITLKFVESMGSTFGVETNTTKDADGKETTTSKLVMKRLYGFSDAADGVESTEQKKANLNADSSAKPKETTVENKQVAETNSTTETKAENPVNKAPETPKPTNVTVNIIGSEATGFTATFSDDSGKIIKQPDRGNKYYGYFTFNDLKGKEAVFADSKLKVEQGYYLYYTDNTRVPETKNVIKGI